MHSSLFKHKSHPTPQGAQVKGNIDLSRKKVEEHLTSYTYKGVVVDHISSVFTDEDDHSVQSVFMGPVQA